MTREEWVRLVQHAHSHLEQAYSAMGEMLVSVRGEEPLAYELGTMREQILAMVEQLRDTLDEKERSR